MKIKYENREKKDATKNINDIPIGTTFQGIIVPDGHSPSFMARLGLNYIEPHTFTRTGKGVTAIDFAGKMLCPTPEDDVVYYYEEAVS